MTNDWLQRITVALFLFAFVPVTEAQPTEDAVYGRWAHVFSGHAVIVELVPLHKQEALLMAWRVQTDPPRCTMYPSTVTVRGDTVVHGGGARWHIDARGGAATFTLPDTTLTYERTRRDPRALCPSSDTDT